MPVILGVSASLRNARFSYGSDLLCKELSELQTKERFLDYLKRQTKRLLVGRLKLPEEFLSKSPYNPVGYKISLAKTREDVASGRKDAFLDGRMENLKKKKSRVAGGRH